MELRGSISIDIDTLKTHFKGFGLKRGEYDFSDFREGMKNFLDFLDPFNIKATFFIVGRDLLVEQNIPILREAVRRGHEIANHTMNHVQGFRLLSSREKEKEVELSERLIEQHVGQRPVGFRNPGWNINNDMVEILGRRGYLYDSSIFPSFLNPLLKLMHYRAMSDRPFPDRTTLGRMEYMFAPVRPYHPSLSSFSKKGTAPLIEFPLPVVPGIRVPFFATFLLKTGLPFFKISYAALKALKRPIIYEFHLFDFVDFEQPHFIDQIPSKAQAGSYIPQSIHTPFAVKHDLFRRAVEIMAKDYQFDTIEHLARKF
ncbi:MAG: polysaccharide deacetylase family protein [Candidatus Wildermuthbacteria bacterium]|nr:polysaccharide deacetylase family protein [Candidatus Wildermuthbacteria bacterium]